MRFSAQITLGGEKMNVVKVFNWIAFIILLIGGLNWGLVGIFNFNLVDWIFGGYNAGSIIVYILVLASAIWLLISAIVYRGIYFVDKRRAN